MANVIDDFKRNASNFLYIFIHDDVKHVFTSVIQKKREKQINYVVQAARNTNTSYNDIRDAIAKQIFEDYGKTPGQILLDLNDYKNVYSKQNISRGIGSTLYKVNPKTGMDSLSTFNSTKYTTTFDTETKEPIGVWKGDKQISYYDKNSQEFKSGATPTSDPNSKNLWANNLNWNSIVMAIIDLFRRIFGNKEESPQQLASMQSDGWYGSTVDTTQASMGSIFPIVMLAAAGYMLVNADDKKKSTKKK